MSDHARRVRERIIAAEVLKLERRQALERSRHASERQDVRPEEGRRSDDEPGPARLGVAPHAGGAGPVRVEGER